MSLKNSNQEYTSVPEGDYDSGDEKAIELAKKVKFMDDKLGSLELSLNRLSQLSFDISGEIELQGGYLDGIERVLEENEAAEEDLTRRSREVNIQHYKNVAYFICFIIFVVTSIIYFVIMYKKEHS